MSFNAFAPEGPIITRLKSHVALVAATQGIYNTISPDDTLLEPGDKPYVVVTHISGTFENTTFRTNIASSLYQVSVYANRQDGDDDAKTIIGYIFGDSEGTDNAPTYGLARWKMTGVTDMASATMVPESYGTAHDAERLHYWMTFSIENVEA
ncbi:MAG: hypothetical protein JJ916_04190 [Phycisphaerales bacterium]|nr:hypothetical protein [Phycisphaerales bacterium]